MKRVFVGFMAVILLLTNVPYAESVYAESATDGNKETVTVDNDDSLTVKGTDSLGSMIAASITEETDKQEDNDGCNIFSIEVNDTEASVSFETTQDASIVVGIYDEDGVELLATGTEEVTADDTDVEVTIDTETMPEFFYLRGFLVDSETFRSMCTAYESPNYTQEMQEFFKKTTDDFDEDRVLNLDDDNTNNFAVYDESVTQLSDEKIVLVSADEDTNTYVFKNADSIASMEKGDTFTYECEDGSTLIVMIDTIIQDGDKVTVTGMDTSMEDVFEYVKIDTTSDTSDIKVDDSYCDENVKYNGIVEDSVNSKRSRAITGEQKISDSLSYTFLEKKQYGLTGDVLLKIGGSIKVYVSTSYQYIETKIDYELAVKIKLSAKAEKKLPIGKISISPIAGVYMEFTPSFVVEVSASVSVDGKLKGTVGFRADSDVGGIENISKTPSFEAELEGEITIFIGLSMEPKIKIVSDALANASLDVTVGAEIKGTMTKKAESASKKHECEKCVDGDISGKAELKFKTELFNSEKFKFTFKHTYTVKIFDWYYSFDHGEGALTTCPHYWYKVTVTVQDSDKNPIEDATVSVPFTLITKDEQGKETKTGVSSATTGEDGKTEGYLCAGTYSIGVSANGYDKVTKKITVADNAKSVQIQMYKGLTESGNGQSGGGGSAWGETGEGDEFDDEAKALLMKNAQTLSLGHYHSGAITEDGSLYMWGYNGDGQLGDGTTVDRTSPVKVLDNVVSVSLGNYHSGAITEDGSLYMWGANGYGQLGDGTTKTRTRPIKVLDNVVAVSLGGFFSGAVTKDGSLYMWGANYYGKLGDGTAHSSDSPVKVLDNVVSISLGTDHSGAITKDGSLYMWGDNFYGQLGNVTTSCSTSPVKVLDSVVSISLGTDHSGAITEDGSLYMWGNVLQGNGYATDPVKVLDDVVSVSLGHDCSGAIDNDGSLYMWGDGNGYGQLGDGTTITKTDPVKVLDNIASVSLGWLYSGAVTTDGSLYMWGYNGRGQLGDGTTENKSSPVKIMDHIKINNTSTYDSVESLSLLSSGSIITESSSLKLVTIATKMTMIASYANLTPNATYTFYVMRDKQAEKPLGSSNLIYIRQATADGDGKLSVTYRRARNISNKEAFVVKSEQEDISAATVSLSDLEYDGEQQYVHPTVALSGKALSEGEDYELLGDYSAQEIGDYYLTVQGIGAYTGTVAVSYKVYGEGSCPVQSITLNKATASLNPDETLQLTATMLPEDASNQELLWTSNNSKIASVDQNGMVTAVAEGTATITATAKDGSGVSANCVVTVAKSTSGENGGNGINSEGESSGGDASGGSISGGIASGGGASGGTASDGGSSSGEVTDTVSEVKDSNPDANDPASVEKNTTTNPDGSETVTTVRKNSDGSVKTVQTTTSKDGSVEKITLKVSAEGNVSLVRTNTSGSTKTTEKYTSAGKNSNVTLSKLTTNAKSVSIPATVKVNGTSYKVTKIAANAFKNNKKITKIIIGKNITKIGKNAFSGDSSLKTIIIKSTSISSIGKNAFKDIKKTATIKLSGTASQRAKLKKLIRKSGIAKTVKIRRG